MPSSSTTIRLTYAALGTLVLASWGFAWDLRSKVATSEQVAAVEAKAENAASRADLQALAVKVDNAATRADVQELQARLEDRLRDLEQTIGRDFMRAGEGKALITAQRDLLEAKMDSVIRAVDSLTRRADAGKP